MNVHKMRRAAQALTEDECVEVLLRGTGGVLALAGGPDEWPYAVPMSYAYRDGIVTFHGAMEGHKHELIAANSNASFCVIDADEVVPADYTTRYRSVICFGVIEVVDDPAEQEDWGIEDIVRISTIGLSDLEIEDLEYYEHQPDFCDKIINEIEKQLKDY